MIELIDDEKNLNVSMISEPLLETLMLDKGLNEVEATDLFYTSKTFTRLADETTKLYLKSWQDIYQMLLRELE
jgi:hypothetical protein